MKMAKYRLIPFVNANNIKNHDGDHKKDLCKINVYINIVFLLNND